MKVLHINAGLEDGGGKTHIVSLLSKFPKDEVTLLTFSDGPVAEDAKKAGISTKIFTQKSRYDLSILKKIKQYINDEKFDIVHTHGARANFFMLYLRKKIHAKWIVTVHSDPTLDFMKRGIIGKIFTKLNMRSLKKADLIIAVTHNFKSMLVNYGLDEKKISVVYNGIDFQDENAIPPKQVHDYFTMMYIARLHPVKGHELLFEALKDTGLKDVRLNIVGDGALLRELEETVHTLGLVDQVKFKGFLSQAGISKEWATTDVSILTSYSESFPLVLLESANFEVPFIATNVGDMDVLIPDETYGWKVPVGDKERIKNAILEAETCYSKNQLYEKGKNIYYYAKGRFSLDNLYKEIAEIYININRLK